MVSLFVKKSDQVHSFHWAEPIIADEILLLYENIRPEPGVDTRKLADDHFRVWHYALQKQNQKAEGLYKAVVDKAASFGISEASISAVNDAVIKLLAILSEPGRLRSITNSSQLAAARS
jgi:hypothetical protein